MNYKTGILIFVFIFIITHISCKTSNLILTVMEPAVITVPTKIQTVAIINRSLPEKENKLFNFLEGLFTNEGIFVDKASSEACINGAVNQLRSLPRYKEVKFINGYDLRGAGSGVFSDPLSWNMVESICTVANVDALITLEVFDSDVFYSKGSEVRTKKEKEQEVKYTVHWKSADIDVKAGWRIYNPANKTIIDESIFVDRQRFSAEGSTEDNAHRNLPPLERAIPDAGYFAGTMFAFRISPKWVNVSREYYKKGTDEFEVAKRFVQTNKWDDASEIWKKYTNHPDPNIAGRACFNMAVSAEVNGLLDVALDWAQKAYNQFGNKKARTYSYELEDRIRKQEILDKQLEKN